MFWLKKWSVQPQNKEMQKVAASLSPPSWLKPFLCVSFRLFPLDSPPPRPVFILFHLQRSNPFFLALAQCRGSANWSRLCRDTGTWHNCWTNGVPFSIRPKQHADRNWRETLITGPAPLCLIGKGFLKELGGGVFVCSCVRFAGVDSQPCFADAKD